MDIDEKADAYNQGVKQGLKHNVSSQETKDFMIKVEQQFTSMENKITKVEDKIDKLPTKVDMELSNRKLLEEVMTMSEEKFASKLTERIVYIFIAMILVSFIGGLVYVVLKFGNEIANKIQI